MRCYICDAPLGNPSYNPETVAYEPCETCLSIIADTVGSFGDRPAASEDELGTDQYDLPLIYSQNEESS